MFSFYVRNRRKTLRILAVAVLYAAFGPGLGHAQASAVALDAQALYQAAKDDLKEVRTGHALEKLKRGLAAGVGDRELEWRSYDVKGEANFVGYVFTSDPGSSKAYGNWLYSPYYNEAARPAPLWRLKKTSTNQHQFTAFEPTITDRVGQGWCCERGPSYACDGHWCGSANTTPVGWVLP